MGRRGGRLFVVALCPVLLVPLGPSAHASDIVFVDIAGSVHETAILRLAEAGITRGCASDRFCPHDPVTRGQMAAFLVGAMGYTERSVSFVDDDGSVFEADIERLGTAGVTRGCDPANNRFCPGDRVTRGQMAAFLSRAINAAGNGVGNTFVDDDGSVFEADIERLAALGLTAGCDLASQRYCPTQPVTRAQMASFIMRMLDYLQELGSAPTDSFVPPASPDAYEPTIRGGWTYIDPVTSGLDTNGDGVFDRMRFDVNGDGHEEWELQDVDHNGRVDLGWSDQNLDLDWEYVFHDHQEDGVIDHGWAHLVGSPHKETYILNHGQGTWLVIDANEDGLYELELYDAMADGFAEWQRWDSNGDGIADTWRPNTEVSSTSGGAADEQLDLGTTNVESGILATVLDGSWMHPVEPWTR